MKRISLACILCLCPFVWTEALYADVLTIQPSKDNTLYEDVAGSLSNGAGPNFFVGKNNSGSIRRSLICFDVSSQIPPGSKVYGVMLTLHVSRSHSGPQPVSIHKVAADWGEGASVAGGGGGGGGAATSGDATWLHTFYDSDFWTLAGGDFVATASATVEVNDVGYYTWGSSSEMVADVQSWVDNPAGEFGWLVLGNEVPAGGTSKRFDSRENIWAFRPTLTIAFTTPDGCLEPIRGDLTGDCTVDFADFAIVAGEWLQSTAPTSLEGTISIEDIGVFGFDAATVDTVRPDIFKPGHFSLFDILVHLDQAGSIDMQYHFDPSMNTHVIDSINGIGNWWYHAYYDGGWLEENAFRMDHYPYKDEMFIEVKQHSGAFTLEDYYTAYADEVARKQMNGGQVIIPWVSIRDCNLVYTDFNNVQVWAHNLRSDTFQEGVITAIDVIMSMADQGLISYDLQWYDSIGSAGIVRSYWVERIDGCQASGMCGFVYDVGARWTFYGLNHIHIPSDYRVLNSPEYERWFWIQLGPCN